MLIKGTLATAFSGKMGGMVAAHNSGGYYVRNFTIPTNPASAFQGVVRDQLAANVSRWVNVLTPEQRDAWKTFAGNVPLINRLGDSRPIPPLAWYNKANVPRLQAGLLPVDDAPEIFALAELTAPVPGAIVAGPPSTLSLAFTNTDPWANEDGGGLLVFASRPQNASINFFKGPYRFAAAIEGDTGTAPTSPQVITLPFPIATGQSLFLRMFATRADGRPSPALTFRVDA